eukprot:CAMPEP_0168402022 /NCGR_PEP_ID=MMETSP0228-20121227/23406_1 /TAXON_ID=133427 /ORGANISM="Protoceratium reticulatum, Strain CCCM 535 (=CCMP 1889)" /LENGTH=32 /DNA_ID= /DNA_START= /DNA_END= /DNA_ORIENTATION=
MCTAIPVRDSSAYAYSNVRQEKLTQSESQWPD